MKKTKKPSNWKMILVFLRGQYKFFVLALALSAAATVVNALTPQIISVTIDSVLGSEDYTIPRLIRGFFTLDWLRAHPGKALLIAAAGIVIVALIHGVMVASMRTLIARGSEGFVKQMRDKLYAHIQKLPFDWHSKNQTGEIIQRCTSDVEMIRNFVTNQLIDIIRIVFLISYSLYIMFSMNVKITLVAAAFFPVIITYSCLFFRSISSRFQAADEAEGRLSTTVQENLTGVRVVKAFGRERLEIERFDVKNNKFSSLWIELGKLLSLYWSLGDLFTGAQIMTVIAVGATMAAHGEITLGMFTAFVSYNATLSWPVRGLGRILSEMSKAGVSIDRVAYILNEEEEQAPEHPQTPAMDQDIEFHDVTFKYDGMEETAAPVVRDLNFTIEKGTTFAILGSTGSGKSTMMHLLDRLYDLKDGEGSITIGGVDIRDIPQQYLRKNIGLVLQEPFLYSRNIRENIGIAEEDPSMEEIREASEIACVDEAIDTFTEGYDTIVGERGVTLSGGQKQRVAIARMLMQKAPIMVFDDSLSAVDAETDVKIRHALKERMSDATVILISHRITTLMQADRILVLKDGAVEAIGTHQELIHQPGMYRDIYEIQMSADDRALLGEGGEEDAQR